MARRSGTSARAQALAKAAEAVARRDAERIAREKAVEAALAEFFHAQGEAERVRSEAERMAAPFEQSTRDAVRALDSLGETRAAIADLTGLPIARVRDYLTEDATSAQQICPSPTVPRFAGGRCDDEQSRVEVLTPLPQPGRDEPETPVRGD